MLPSAETLWHQNERGGRVGEESVKQRLESSGWGTNGELLLNRLWGEVCHDISTPRRGKVRRSVTSGVSREMQTGFKYDM